MLKRGWICPPGGGGRRKRKMIPKVIHYCWFGRGPLPDLAKTCIASWKKYCPDYEIREWNEDNFDIACCDFAKEAYQEKRWAFVSDYARLKVVFQYGGIYLDTDVELVRSLDPLLEHKCYLATESSGFVNTGLGFGAEKGSRILQELLEEYEKQHFRLPDGTLDVEPCPQKNTFPLYKYGYRFSAKEIWKTDDVTVYPPEYFCPLDYETRSFHRTENTYSIHHYSALWIPEDVKELEKKIKEVDRTRNKCVAFVIHNCMRYSFYKKKGEERSVFGYVYKRLKLKYHRMKTKRKRQT